MSFVVFLFSALMFGALLRVLKPGVLAGGPRREGIAFLAATLIPPIVALGWISRSFATGGETKLEGVSEQAAILAAFAPLVLTAGVYALSAARGALKLPPWIADLIVIVAAAFSVSALRQPVIEGARLPFSNEYLTLGMWAAPLTILWIWLIARMTAALNRVPRITGGYIGIVALSLLAYNALHLQGTTSAPQSAIIITAALAAVGLVSVPLALKFPEFNMGWSCALAMGFLLAQVTVAGLSKNLALAILALLMLVFGLPLLDVSFYRLRAARRGEKVKWERSHLRLHEALARRGVSLTKISLIYLCIAAYFSALGLLFVATATWPLIIRLLLVGILGFAGFIAFFSVTRVLMRRAEGEEIPTDVEAFGVRISPVTMTEALDKIEEFIRSRQPHHVVTSDANAILRAQEDTEYAEIVRRAALITPDGYGVMWGARLMNLPIYERVTGVDMVTGICERAAKNSYSIYILGSDPGVAATAARNLMEKYPGLRVAGTYHGFWRKEGAEAGLSRDEADAKMADEVRAAAPDVLFVAMGIPLQEKFIAAHKERMNVPVSLGVGGSFDVYSGKFNRAPERIQRMGLEWIYRVWIDPSRWKRMGYVPRFMMFALREWMFGPRGKRRRDAEIS